MLYKVQKYEKREGGNAHNSTTFTALLFYLLKASLLFSSINLGGSFFYCFNIYQTPKLYKLRLELLRICHDFLKLYILNLSEKESQ